MRASHYCAFQSAPALRAYKRRAGARARRALCSAAPPPPPPPPPPPSANTLLSFQIGAADGGTRVDKLLASRCGARSRSHVQALIRDGHVRIDGAAALSKSRRVVAGETVSVQLEAAAAAAARSDDALMAQPMALHVLYEDEHLAFINKAAGMVTHPAPGNWSGTLVNALAARYESIRRMRCARAGIVHRLDKGTSGVMVVAKTQCALDKLGALFAARAVQKEYIAITVNNACGRGCVSATIEQPIGRHRNNRLKMDVVPVVDGGRAAKSIVQTVAHDAHALLHVARVRIETGRTHQIRVHLRHARAPVLGDQLYGASDVNARFAQHAKRAMLHAWRLQLTHPMSGQTLRVSAPLAEDMRALIAQRMGARVVQQLSSSQ